MRYEWLVVLLLLPIALAQDLVLTDMNAEQISGLSTDQKNAITAEKLFTCFQSIECASNLGDLSGYPNAVAAIEQRYGVTVAFGSSARLVGGVLTSSLGSFDFNKEKGWEIKVTSEGEIEVVKPLEIKEGSISSNDKFTIPARVFFTTAFGKRVQIRSLSFGNGQAFVKPGSDNFKLDFDGDNVLDFEVPASDKLINIYFDDKPRVGNYVSLTEHKVKIGSTDGKVTLVPQPGSQLFQMIMRDYEQKKWIPDKRATMSMTVRNGDSITATSREDQDKTILLEHQSNGGDFEIKTGRGLEVSSQEGQIHVKNPDLVEVNNFDNRRSVAFRLKSDLSSEVLEDRMDLIVSSSNRWGFFNLDEYWLGNIVNYELNDELWFNQILGAGDLQEFFSTLEFVPPDLDGYKDISPNMAQAVYQWLIDRPGVDRYMNRFEFNTDLNAYAWDSDPPFMTLGEARMDPTTSLNDPSRGDVDNLGTPKHEVIHLVDFKATKILAQSADLVLEQNEEFTDKFEELNEDYESTKEDIKEELSDLYDNEIYKKYNELSDKQELERISDLLHGEEFDRNIDPEEEEELSRVEDRILELDSKLRKLKSRFSLNSAILREEHYTTKPNAMEKKRREIIQNHANSLAQDKDFRDELLKLKGAKLGLEHDESIVSAPFDESIDIILRGGLDSRASWTTDKTNFDHLQILMSVPDIPNLVSRGELSIKDVRKITKKISEIMFEKRGVYLHYFSDNGEEFSEVPTINNELSVQDARKQIEASQYLYEMVMMTDPPEWMRKEHEKKYWKIVGGPDSEYCKANGCGRCIQFPVVCEVENE